MLFFNRKRQGDKKKSRFFKSKGTGNGEEKISEQKGSEERRQKTLDVDDDTEEQFPVESEPEREPALIVISGAGIVGLVLALALKKRLGVTAELYDQADAFVDDVGAGMGMYPNGLRVIRDISPTLLQAIRDVGYPYLYRRIERHDGTEVTIANESILCEGDSEIESIGIRRWKLQKVLFEAAKEEGIPIYFGKKTVAVKTSDKRSDGLTQISFEDGTSRLTQVLIGADGSKSRVRNEVVPNGKGKILYTGTTCLMGLAARGRDERGICTPCSTTTKCHACYFPTGENEQCFQIHFPIPEDEANPGNWGTLSEAVGKEECRKLAQRLANEGWNEKYLEPLHHVTKAIRIGFCIMEEHLERFSYGPNNRVVLVGDAAHPPVPYLGQGAQQGLEDAGILVELLKNMCVDVNGHLDLTQFCDAMKLYDKMRVPRTMELVEKATSVGAIQQKRANCKKYNQVKEQLLQRDVFFHETIPVMFVGATYDYKKDVQDILKQELFMPVIKEVASTDRDDGPVDLATLPTHPTAPMNVAVKA